MKHNNPEIKTGDSYPGVNVLHAASDRAVVFYTCCGRTARTRMDVLERHVRTGREVCVQCERAAKRAAVEASKHAPRRGAYNDQPGAVIHGIVRAVRHDWWPMVGGMGR